VVWFTVAWRDDVVNCPVRALEVFAACDADWFKDFLGLFPG
jgi:hypothetical protein